MIDVGNLSTALGGMTFIDLFAGIGGFRYALQSFGARCVFESEWDPAAADTYEANHGVRPNEKDIATIKAEDIDPMDIVCGGFPCLPFSVSGKREGFEDKNHGHLFFEIMRIVHYHRPKVVFLENVKNIATHDKARTMKVIRDELKKEGYPVPHDKVLNASDFGVPQARERMFILCFRDDDDITSPFPLPRKEKIYLEDVLVLPKEAKPFEVDVSGKGLTWTRKDHEYPQPKALKPIQVGKVNRGGQGDRIYHPNGHAITLSSGGGGTGAKTGLYAVGNKIRRLTPRECARASGFPDDFILNKKNSECYRQFGNSVVINVLQHIIREAIQRKKI